MNKRNLIYEAGSALLVLLYTYTVISKATHFSTFRHALSGSPLIGLAAGWLVWVLIGAEAVVVLLLFFPLTRRRGLQASLVLLLLFTVYLVYMVLFAAKLPCACGGVISRLGWRQHIFFNLFFIIVNGLALRQGGRYRPARQTKKIFMHE